MPGRKYGRRFTKRRKLYRRGRSGGLRKQVRRVARQVRRIRNMVETKQYTSTIQSASLSQPSNPAVGQPPCCWYVPQVGEGDDYNQRTGKKITAKTLHLNFYTAIKPPTVAPTGNIMPQPHVRVRVMLFWDRNVNNSGTYAIGDLLEGVTSTMEATDYIMAPLNWNNRKRFRMLMDKTFVLTTNWSSDAATQTSGYTNQDYTTSMIKFKKTHFKLNKNIQFSGQSDQPSSCVRNSLWFVVFSDSGNRAGTTPTAVDLKFQYRMTFQDI